MPRTTCALSALSSLAASRARCAASSRCDSRQARSSREQKVGGGERFFFAGAGAGLGATAAALPSPFFFSFASPLAVSLLALLALLALLSFFLLSPRRDLPSPLSRNATTTGTWDWSPAGGGLLPRSIILPNETPYLVWFLVTLLGSLWTGCFTPYVIAFSAVPGLGEFFF